MLYDYACTNWAAHLRLSQVSADRKIHELLEWFLNPGRHPGLYESWQQMYHHDIQQYYHGRPPLHYAIDFGIPFLIKALIPNTSQLDTLHNGMAALHEAARCGDLDTCVMLLNLGASLERESGPNAKHMTALHFAAEGGHPPVIQMLLAKGASPHTQSSSQSTPFYRAARSGSLEALKILYSAGSDINAKTWDNWTALFEAVARGFVHIASQLLEWGADPTITTHAGKSALMLISAARHRGHMLHSLHEDIVLNLEGQPDSQPNSENSEAITLQEIQKLQARILASRENIGNSFYEYLANLNQRCWQPDRMENKGLLSMKESSTQDSGRSNYWTCCECGESGMTIFYSCCSCCGHTCCANCDVRETR